MSDINCLCCGREPSEFHPNHYVAWIWCLFCGKYATLRNSDNSLVRTLSFFCCMPFFSMKHTYEEESDSPYRETVNCCCLPCCIDCIETPYYCQCDMTTVACDTRTCFYQEYDPVSPGEEKSEANEPGV